MACAIRMSGKHDQHYCLVLFSYISPLILRHELYIVGSTGLLCESETIPPLTTITTTTTITSTTTTTTTDSLSKSILVTAYTNCSLCGFLVGENNPAELVLKSLSNEIGGYTIIKEFVPVKYS